MIILNDNCLFSKFNEFFLNAQINPTDLILNWKAMKKMPLL